MKLTNLTEDYLFLLERGRQPKINRSVNFVYISVDCIEIEYFIETENRKDIWLPELSREYLYPYDTVQEKDANMFDPQLLLLIKEMLLHSVL